MIDDGGPAGDHGDGSEDGDDLLDILEEARDFGYLGPGPLGTHIRHAIAFAKLAQRSAVPNQLHPRAADLGSGGGLPGLVVARMWPDSTWVFIDAHMRRMETMRSALDRLGLWDRSEIVCGRAEEVCHRPDLRGSFDLVLARGFAGPAVTAECAAPLLKVGGRLVVSEPPDDRGRWSISGLAELQLEGEVIEQDGFSFFEARSVGTCPPRYPRRVGVPGKRPLF
jgi:16S rRNA (guanine527-N7)-methyltransferase